MTRDTKPLHSSGHGRSLTVDWERYGAMLDASDLSDEEKLDFLRTLWSITTTFVDLGFGVHSVQLACGQDDHDPRALAADLLDLHPTSTSSEFAKAATPVDGPSPDSDTDRGSS